MKHRYTGRTIYEVILFRSKGRLVKSVEAGSTYAAKQIAKKWDDKYDKTYSIEIRPSERVVIARERQG